MFEPFFLALLSALILDIISLLSIFITRLRLQKYYLFVFATSVMISLAFFHLIPEAFESGPNSHLISFTIIASIVMFFFLERFLHWRHCHQDNCEVHPATYLVSVGDAIHNFLDGVVLYFTYSTNVLTGILTTLAFILHEIPQEMSDFIILRHLGFSFKRAVLWNFFVGLTALLGVLLGFFINSYFNMLQPFFISFVAGSFVYVAMSDLIPILHEERDLKKALIAVLIFFLTALLILSLELVFVQH